MVDSRLTRGVDDDGNPWAICQVCTERTTEKNLALDPTDGKRWDVCKDCYPKTVNLVCWDDETGIGHPTHDLNGDLDCRRCTHKANWCCVGDWVHSGEYGDAEWDECMQPAEFCARPAEGPGCMPVCGVCKQHIEHDPALKKKYGVVVFEPYDGRTGERFCSETCSHDDEWWDGWTLEPPVPTELEPSFTERLIDELEAIRADLKNCARDTEGLMYERGPDGLHLRDFIAVADTNGPPEDADARIWAARGRLGNLLDLLERGETL